jgi:hypothetical protein
MIEGLIDRMIEYFGKAHREGICENGNGGCEIYRLFQIVMASIAWPSLRKVSNYARRYLSQ